MRSLKSPASSSKAALRTGAGMAAFTTDLGLPGSPLARFRAASFAWSTQPKSPSSPPPLSADWHSETVLQALLKLAQPSATKLSRTLRSSTSASSVVRLTGFRRTGLMGWAPFPCQFLRRIWLIRTFLNTSSALPRCLPSGSSAGAVRGHCRCAQAAASWPCAPPCRAALRRATLAARGRPWYRCGVVASIISPSSSWVSPAERMMEIWLAESPPASNSSKPVVAPPATTQMEGTALLTLDPVTRQRLVPAVDTAATRRPTTRAMAATGCTPL
mmetsp:Transcript_24834/g.78216  ORF Transcript_24834/g.78216 Transcript_24834/m.78216 type:complete len:273 (-) Transcript_24834:1185-2003(-)